MNSDLSDFIRVTSPQVAGNLLLLVDTEAHVSIIKISNILSNVTIDRSDVMFLKGITSQKWKSIGTVVISLKFNHLNIEHKFSVVSDDFPIPCGGMLGKDFLRFHKCVINYDDMSLQIQPKNLTPTKISIQDEVLPGVVSIPPRSQIFRMFHVKSEQFPCVIESQDIDGVRVPTTIVHTKRSWIRVLNTSDDVKLVKADQLRSSNINDYDLYSCDGQPLNDEISVRARKLIEILSPNIPNHAKDLVIPLCTKYSDIFHVDGDRPTVNNFYKQSLNLKDNEPVFVRNYRLPQSQRAEITAQVDKLLKNNLIEPSTSNFNSPLILVPKKSLDGKPKFRMCVDYRMLNRKLIPDRFPLPRIEDIFDNLGRSKYFSVMDLQSGFHQIPLTKDARKYTAFSTNTAMYQWKVLPFGLSIAPASFSRMMILAFSGLSPEHCFTYMDDLIVIGFSEKNHIESLEKVFAACRKCNLRLNPEKCHFFRTEVAFLGHLCTSEGLKADPKKISVMQRYPRPHDKESVHRFVCFCNYYRRFVRDFAKVTKPLTNLVKKRVEFVWTDECENAFQFLKQKLLSTPILKYPDYTKPFTIIVDASDYACGGVLTQRYDDIDMPICYISKSFDKAEKRKPPIEKELLAIHFGITSFRPYIYGRSFVVKSDHKPLVYLYNLKNPSSKLTRIRLELEEYDFEVQYIRGRDNVLADALSRITINELKQQYGTVDILAVTRSMTKNQMNVANVSENISNEINCDDIYVFEDFNSNFDTKVPRIKTKSVTISKKTGKVVAIELKMYQKHVKMYQLNLVNEKANLTNLFSKLRDAAKRIGTQKLQISRQDLIFSKLTIDSFKKVGNKVLKPITMQIIKPAKLVVDATEKLDLIRKFHDDPLFGGHAGQKRLYAKLRNDYFWKGMTRDVAKYVQNCENCKLNKHHVHTKEEMVLTETPCNPFDVVIVDTVGPLPKSNRGNVYAVTMICDLTKYLICAATVDKSAKEIARAIFEKFVLVFGPMKSIRTDRGTEYTNETVKELCKLLGTEHKVSTSYHHQTLGSIERNHGELNTYLRMYLSSNIADWDNYLDHFSFSYNICKHSSLGFKYSPFELIFARSPNLPSTLLTGDVQPLYDHSNYVKESKFKLQRAYVAARKFIDDRKLVNKKYYDRDANPLNVSMGDTVYLKLEPYNKLKTLGKAFKVVEINNTNVKISDGEKTRVVHKNRLYKC